MGTCQDASGIRRRTSWEKLRLADELTAAGRTGEEVAAEIGISPATLYNWRRQYGGVRAEVNKLALPDPLDTVAIYMLRRNATDHSWTRRHQLPVAVWTSSDSPDVWARTIGTGWERYSDFLLNLATGRILRIPEVGEKATLQFVRDVVATLRGDRPTLLLTWSQNLRLDWKDLQNNHAMPDVLAVGGTDISHLAPQLRHVTIRARHDGETPEAYGLANDIVGLPSGLFHYPNSSRVFASIAPKPASAKTHAKAVGTRVEEIFDDKGRSLLDTTRPAFNPQLLELAVAVQNPDDDPRVWAAVAHAQRPRPTATPQYFRGHCTWRRRRPSMPFQTLDDESNDDLDLDDSDDAEESNSTSMPS